MEAGRVEIRTVLLQVLEHLIKDLVGPFRLDEPRRRHTDQDVAKGVRVQDVRVVQNDRHHQTKPSSLVILDSSSAAARRSISSWLR